MDKKVITGCLFFATVALAAMGCWFCWHCPSKIYPPESHGLFWRQLAWNGAGLAVFAGAWLAGWRRLLKAAPWLMAAWMAAIAAAQFSCSVRGVHKWLSIGQLRVNVAICFMPVFALFVAWQRDRKRLRPWMWWTALFLASAWAVWHVAGNVGRMERLAAFFNPGNWMQDRAYMSRQLLAAFGASHWFGDAGRSLGLLPCPESDGMMSASALMFGKWFPAAIAGLLAAIGGLLTLFWKGICDAAKRLFAFFFGLWLIVPAAYCFLHSLSLLPVAGMSPALAGYGGTAVVMAWFGTGVLAAMARKDAPGGGGGDGAESGVKAALGVCCAWLAVFAFALLALALKCRSAEAGNLKFAEPRPSDMVFGEFGLVAKRGRILAADGSPLAYTKRAWRFCVDPAVAVQHQIPSSRRIEIARGLGVSEECMEDSMARKDSRYVFLGEFDSDDPAADYFERNMEWLTRCSGIIREPVQKRVYSLGEAATAVVGFMHGGAYTNAPRGAGGLEWAFDKALAGTNGAYDASLRLNERIRHAAPVPGSDIRTTIVPDVQKTVWGVLAAACATNGAESAFALVMKVPSGEIAAMASWPSFDPSMRRDFDKWDSSMAVNHAAQTVFEPGGIAKPIVEAIVLDSGVAADMTNAISLAGAENLHAALHRFGFGSKTGTVGIPGEAIGILASKPESWTIDTTAPMSVGRGRGFAVTGLQLAQAYATLANNGTLVRPVLVKTASPNSAVRVVSPSSADAIMRMFKSPMPSIVQMCERDHRTGRSVYSSINYIASCVGFHPAEKPEYVIVVSFAKPKFAHTGEEMTVPILKHFRELLKFSCLIEG